MIKSWLIVNSRCLGLLDEVKISDVISKNRVTNKSEESSNKPRSRHDGDVSKNLTIFQRNFSVSYFAYY